MTTDAVHILAAQAVVVILVTMGVDMVRGQKPAPTPTQDSVVSATEITAATRRLKFDETTGLLKVGAAKPVGPPQLASPVTVPPDEYHGPVVLPETHTFQLRGCYQFTTMTGPAVVFTPTEGGGLRVYEGHGTSLGGKPVAEVMPDGRIEGDPVRALRLLAAAMEQMQSIRGWRP